jgi:hypothetical protein
MKVSKSGIVSLRSLFPHKDTSGVAFYQLSPSKNGLELTLYDAFHCKIKELPPVKKLRCTKNLVAMTRQATQRCYDNAIKRVARAEKVKESEVRDQAKTVYRDKVDHAYRQYVCKLETEVLEAILLCHNKHKFRRAQITLKAISDELGNRVILNDSSRKK